jgi:F-type H+-transporting ATPase subunit b
MDISLLLHDTYTWVTLSFILFLGIMIKVGVPTLLSKLDQKIATIRTEVETAARLRAEAEALLLEFEQRQRDTEKDADQLVSAARDQAESLRLREEEKLAELMRNKEQQLNERLDMLRDQTIADLRQIAAKMAIETVEKMIAEKMDTETRTRLLNRAMDQVSQRLA